MINYSMIQYINIFINIQIISNTTSIFYKTILVLVEEYENTYSLLKVVNMYP